MTEEEISTWKQRKQLALLQAAATIHAGYSAFGPAGVVKEGWRFDTTVCVQEAIEMLTEIERRDS